MTGLLTKQQAQERYNLCKTCEYLSSMKVCTKCNCFAPVKTKFSGQSCPIGLWDVWENHKVFDENN